MKVAMASCHRMALGVGGIASPSLRKNQKSTMICVVCRNIGSSVDDVCGLCSAPRFFSAAQAASRITVSGIKFPSHGNRLEMLVGDRQGQHSIRINDQWRVCFVWTEKGVADVEIVDYH